MRSQAYAPLPVEPSGRRRYRQHKFTRRRCMASPLTSIVFLAGVFTAFAALVVLSRREPPPSPPPAVGRTAVDRLFARQSTSLEQATARYALKYGRAPPRNYERWYRFAKDRGCLIDEYDQVQRDFEPFYQLAKEDPTFFRRMVRRGTQLAVAEDMGMKTFQVRDGEASMTDDRGSSYNGGWMEMLQTLGPILPDLTLLINHRDEPRVAFDARVPHAQAGALNALSANDADATPFRHAPRPTTAGYYKDEGHCVVPNEPMGFMTYANDASAFLLASASADFTTDLYPVLSQSKIYPCFADIVFPSEFHYARSPWAPKYAFPDNVPWADKKPALYWRGQSTGGWIRGDNYHGFARFRLLDIARAHAHAHPPTNTNAEPLFDVALSALYTWFCQDGCDADAIRAEYNITEAGATPREAGYAYKYVLDLDGNAFSGRYLGLLRSGSLVFKADRELDGQSTLFTEYFADWLRPFEHFIPVLPDLSDLVERLEWARSHDAEARRIQQAGAEVARRVLTDAQNDCYWGMVLSEWGRLEGMAGEGV
ncbi:glycosyl transferase family 90-domain-containing protein [Mycena latifolia]|nr:glycosyl transferase family 90-domain-containing protein [Mycena latifolia]